MKLRHACERAQKGTRGAEGTHYSLLSDPMVGSGVNTKDDTFARFALAEMSCRGVYRDTWMRPVRLMGSVNVPVFFFFFLTWVYSAARSRTPYPTLLPEEDVTTFVCGLNKGYI